MIILSIRTDKPEAEIGLFDDHKKLAYHTWQAHRELAETLHIQIAKNLQSASKDWADIEGIIAYKGPGSFTGLRIGLSVANALAYSFDCPIVATTGDEWIKQGITALKDGESNQIALPEYGSAVNITKPKK
ncbi:MAG: tRNA (adenosine(37)-N6)-threonylcarbamoyltransferase complex dimerization subunit type 1 TsaB [Patescibacteria group bacterium]